MLLGSSGLFAKDRLLHPKSQGHLMQAAVLSLLGWAKLCVLAGVTLFAPKTLTALKSPNSLAVYPNGFVFSVFWKKKIIRKDKSYLSLNFGLSLPSNHLFPFCLSLMA